MAGNALVRHYRNILRGNGIKQQLTSPYSPESNGKSEKLSRTPLEAARTVMVDSAHIPDCEKLWAEAVSLANYVRNRLYSTAGKVSTVTPYQALYNKNPNLSYMRALGSSAFVHTPKQKRSGKFSRRSAKGYLVGIEACNSCRVYFPNSCKIIISRDVTVIEGMEPKETQDTHFGYEVLMNIDDEYGPEINADHSDTVDATPTHTEAPVTTVHSSSTPSGQENQLSNQDVEQIAHDPGLRRSSRRAAGSQLEGTDTIARISFSRTQWVMNHWIVPRHIQQQCVVNQSLYGSPR